jgi:hypothetical protein
MENNNVYRFIRAIVQAIMGDKIYYPIRGKVIRNSVIGVSGFDSQDEGFWLEVECFTDKFSKRIWAEAIQGYSAYDKPSLGDWVIVQFIDGDISKPVITGISQSPSKTINTIPYLVQGVSIDDETAHAAKRIVSTSNGYLHLLDERLQRILINVYDKLRITWDGLLQTIGISTQGNNTLLIEDNVQAPSFTLKFTDGTVLAVDGMLKNGKLINKNFKVEQPHGTAFISSHVDGVPVVSMVTAGGVVMRVTDVNNNDKYEHGDILISQPNGNTVTLLQDGTVEFVRGDKAKYKFYPDGRLGAQTTGIDLWRTLADLIDVVDEKWNTDTSNKNVHKHPLGNTLTPDPAIYKPAIQQHLTKLNSVRKRVNKIFTQYE